MPNDNELDDILLDLGSHFAIPSATLPEGLVETKAALNAHFLSQALEIVAPILEHQPITYERIAQAFQSKYAPKEGQ